MGIMDDTAAKRLAELQQHFREHPALRLEDGHSGRRSSSPPLRLATLDHIRACVQEVTDLCRDINPTAGPLPQRVQDVYDWCRANTECCEADQRLRREAIIYRQSMEHAILTGDHTVVRPHRCPACRTFGLMWVVPVRRAVCTNLYCTRKDGRPNSFTLARLAYECVASWSGARASGD